MDDASHHSASQHGAPQQSAPDWYPDPWGRHELRYWDGELWTEHVSSHGRQSVAPIDAAEVKTVQGAQSPQRVQQQVDKHFANAERRGAEVDRNVISGGGLLEQKVLVVNQKMKLIEVNSEYAIFDRDGSQIGAVRQVGQSNLKKVVRFFGSIDQFFTHKLQVVDAQNRVVLGLTRPAKFFKSRVIVTDETGAEVGEIVQRNMFGKISFSMLAGGQEVGMIKAENWRAWNFSVQNASGEEVARVTKTFEGVLKTMFTTADNYVVQINRDLEGPLQKMVVAAALTIDTALKQDSRGLGSMDFTDWM